MSKSRSETNPQTTSNVTQVDRRIGVEGEGNLIQGEGASFSSRDTVLSTPITGDGNFAPIFNFASTGRGNEEFDPAGYRAARRDLEDNFNRREDIRAEYGSLENYLKADFQANRNGNATFPKSFYDQFIRNASGSSGIRDKLATATLRNVPGYQDARQDLVDNFNRDPQLRAIYGTLENYLKADFEANKGGNQVFDRSFYEQFERGPAPILPTEQPPPPPPGTPGGNIDTSIPGNFGVAIEGPGTVAGGAITAPVAGAEDSIAIQTGAGGNVIEGDAEPPILSGTNEGDFIAPGDDSPVIKIDLGADQAPGALNPDKQSSILAPVAANDSQAAAAADSAAVVLGDAEAPIVTAPISGPAQIAAGDIEQNAPIIAGNQGPVSIQTSDPAVSRAAIQGAADAARAASENAAAALTRSLAFAEKSLGAVAESRKDPEERVSSESLKTVAVLAAIFGAIAIFSTK